MNGKLGDHPLTDIVNHHAPVYSPEVDAVVAELVELEGSASTEAALESLDILWAPRLMNPNATSASRVDVTEASLAEARIALENRREQMLREAEVNGWDMASLSARLAAARAAAIGAWRGVG